ncbi:MAG: NAD(P)/FAD-dependent oxidoreductase [Treponema sp.]|nr:NAD(P)/FAD-dependent oxidoreductase [Treponema sp.]
MERFDIAIIGTGPAGCEAALTARARNKSILFLGSKALSEKVQKAHLIKNYLGLPEVSGEVMQKDFLEHLSRNNIEITEDKINAVYAMGDYFALQGQGTNYEAKSVILACGMSQVHEFPGELMNLGRGVSYCATCDASLYKGKTAVVIGYAPKEEKEAEFLSEIADKVTYVAMYPDCKINKDNIEVLTKVKPVSIEKGDGQMILNLETGKLSANGIFVLRESVAPSQLVPGLFIEENHVKVDRSLKTNIPGLFAAGDITGTPYQYIKAAGEGNVAALSAVNYLAEKGV